MLQRWRNLRAAVPGSFLAALFLAAGFLAFVTWDQSHWWRWRDDYGFGWLVPAFVAFVVYDRWPAIVAAVAACAAQGSPRAAGAPRWVLRALVAVTLLCGVVMFLLGALWRAGYGPSNPGTLAITLGTIGIIFPLIFLHAPEPSEPVPASLSADARLRLVLLFLFPVLVWLISAPLVSVLESELNLFLLRKIVTVVAFVFDVLGLPIEQRGNVLALPTGDVGVAEACSGIRSLTGCLFAGSFLAAVLVERLWKKIALVIAALVLALMMNLLRSLFLTAWAYRHGPAAIEGTVHDAAGYAVLGVTVVGLLVLVKVLNWRPPALSP